MRAGCHQHRFGCADHEGRPLLVKSPLNARQLIKKLGLEAGLAEFSSADHGAARLEWKALSK